MRYNINLVHTDSQDKVLNVLDKYKDGLTVNDIHEMTGVGLSTIRYSLNKFIEQKVVIKRVQIYKLKN